MGKGYNNDHYNNSVGYIGFCEVLSNPSEYHTSQPVTTKPVKYHCTGIATTGYASYQPSTRVRRIEDGSKIKPNQSQNKPFVIHSSKPNHVQNKPFIIHSSKPNQVQNKPVVIHSSKPNHVQNKPVVIYSSKPNQVQSYETTSRIKHVDKQTGGYKRVTTKEKVSSSQIHVERGSGRVCVKNETKKTSTVRIGNSSGYTEYYTEQRVRRVDFGHNGSNKRLTHGGY